MDLLDLGMDLVRSAPHLYAITVVYWCLLGAIALTRYGLRRMALSDLLIRALLVVGVIAFVLAFVDVALRGQHVIHVSLVAYLATPLGIGRALLARFDGRPLRRWRGLWTREATYVLAFVAFVGLSAVDGDLWWFTRPELDRTDPVALVEGTNWLHLMASVFGIVAVLELLMTTGEALRDMVRSIVNGTNAGRQQPETGRPAHRPRQFLALRSQRPTGQPTGRDDSWR